MVQVLLELLLDDFNLAYFCFQVRVVALDVFLLFAVTVLVYIVLTGLLLENFNLSVFLKNLLLPFLAHVFVVFEYPKFLVEQVDRCLKTFIFNMKDSLWML